MNDFEMPTFVTPKLRTTVIANSFTNGVMPQIEPSEEEIDFVLSIFQQSRGKELKCVYCDEPATEWDHFRPLISNKKPSGYMTDIYNLVPCCHLCNCSKGAKNWRDYLNSTSKKSARTRLASKNQTHLIDKNGRLYKNLEAFEKESDKKVHHIKISYDANDNITEIKWYKGNTLISAKDSRIVKEITDYYSKLDIIKQLLKDVTNDGNRLRDKMNFIINETN